jgi:biopolymer transport protein ExbD
MQAKRPKKKGGVIPVDSFSDLAFLLNIFFILVTSITQSVGFTTDVPAGEKSQQQQEQTTVVKLNNEEIRLNDKVVNLPGLEQKLRQLQLAEKKTETERMVVLEPTGQVRYQRFFEVMATITAVGGVAAIVREDKEQAKQ